MKELIICTISVVLCACQLLIAVIVHKANKRTLKRIAEENDRRAKQWERIEIRYNMAVADCIKQKNKYKHNKI